MSWTFKDNLPIYTQLMDQITLQIISGAYEVGQKLPSVRELASEASVNPNTMQKALTELERKGLVYSIRTSGRFITEDSNMIKEIQFNLAKDEIKEFLDKMNKIGYDNDKIITAIQNVIKEVKQ